MFSIIPPKQQVFKQARATDPMSELQQTLYIKIERVNRRRPAAAGCCTDRSEKTRGKSTRTYFHDNLEVSVLMYAITPLGGSLVTPIRYKSACPKYRTL